MASRPDISIVIPVLNEHEAPPGLFGESADEVLVAQVIGGGAATEAAVGSER
jgi:hypothetical protein